MRRLIYMEGVEDDGRDDGGRAKSTLSLSDAY